MSLVQEFKQFAVRGNVIDLAVGVVVGAAFGKIVGGVSFEDMGTSLGMGPDGQTEIVLKWGAFVQTIFDFTLIAAALFMAIKAINRLKAAPAPAEPAAPPAPPRNEVLLEEIRDLLKK